MPESLNDAILTTWFEYQGDLQAVIEKHKLTAAQIRDFADDPIVRKTLDDYEALLARRQRIHAMSHQHNAAEMLSKSMFESASTIECRRAATALARLTRDMLRTTTSPARGGEGGAPESAATAQRPSPVIDTAPRSVPAPSESPSATIDEPLPSRPAESLDKPRDAAADAHPTTPNLIPASRVHPASPTTHRHAAQIPRHRSSDPPTATRKHAGADSRSRAPVKRDDSPAEGA